jgi:hypothetical protein
MQYHGRIPPPVLQIITKEKHSFVRAFLSNRPELTVRRRQGTRIKNDEVGTDVTSESGFPHLATFGAVLFSGIHIGAWNFDFPSNIELIFWRRASVYATAFMPMLLPLVLGEDVVSPNHNIKFRGVYFPFLTILYTLSRLFLLVEGFRTLCFLPPDTYVFTWVTNVPLVA